MLVGLLMTECCATLPRAKAELYHKHTTSMYRHMHPAKPLSEIHDDHHQWLLLLHCYSIMLIGSPKPKIQSQHAPLLETEFQDSNTRKQQSMFISCLVYCGGLGPLSS